MISMIIYITILRVKMCLLKILLQPKVFINMKRVFNGKDCQERKIISSFKPSVHKTHYGCPYLAPKILRLAQKMAKVFVISVAVLHKMHNNHKQSSKNVKIGSLSTGDGLKWSQNHHQKCAKHKQLYSVYKKWQET